RLMTPFSAILTAQQKAARMQLIPEDYAQEREKQADQFLKIKARSKNILMKHPLLPKMPRPPNFPIGKRMICAGKPAVGMQKHWKGCGNAAKPAALMNRITRMPPQPMQARDNGTNLPAVAGQPLCAHPDK